MFLRRLIIILIAVIILGAGFQVLRSFGMLDFIKNVNSRISIAPAQSQQIPATANLEKYLIVSDLNEENSILTTQQLQKTLDYMKKDYITVNSGDTVENTGQYDCIFFTFERLDRLSDPDKYTDYVRNGGSLLLLVRPVVDKTFKKISEIIGIDSYSEKVSNFSGIKIISSVIPGGEGFQTDSKVILNSSLDLKLKDSAKIYLVSYEDNPLLWRQAYGNGRFIVFNGTMLNAKLNRGLICAVISLGKSELVYPVMNIKMVHIDDFPAPIPSGTDEDIFSEFSRDIPQFYREVWWSDMIKISKKYDIKYTGFIIEAYNNNTKAPFKKGDSSKLRNLLIYGRELTGIGGEMGIHGYNHQSLAYEGYIKQKLGYSPWYSFDDMIASIKELLRFIHSVFGQYELRAYVPPSNILSPEGREAVKAANPDLRIIASIYQPDIEKDEYEQEFEVADDGIIEFPRITAGYEKNDEVMWTIYNGISLYGIFAHFVHPDDVLDPERNGGKSWTLLEKEFSSILEEVNQKYKWLRSFTISSASQELLKYIECKTYIDYSGNMINIYTDNFRNDIYCILRTEKKVVEAENCEYRIIGDGTYLLTIKNKICSLKVN